jgi:uncharacterized protein (DUF2147 family)
MLCAGQGAFATPVVTPLTQGIWRNPHNTVHVEIRPCGDAACGYVVWASEQAIADARKGGTENLIGLQLFRDFVQDKDGAWRGKVFVPDLNVTFSGAAVPLDPDTLRAKGCLLGKFLCRSQIWRRIQSIAG